MKTKPKMLCPACRTEFVPGQLRAYETIAEHVSDPNGEFCRPNRGTWVCPNPQCFAHNDGTYWAEDGEGPYSFPLHWDDSCWIDKNSAPFNSYHRKMYFNIHYHDEDRRIKLTKRWTLLIKVSYDSDDYGNKKGKRRRYNLIRDGIYYNNGIRMLIFSIKSFYRRRAMSAWYGQNEAKDIVERSKWPRAEWWRKAAALWIKAFHSKELAS